MATLSLYFFSVAYKMQYHNFEKDMMLTGTHCMTRAWRAHKACRSCLKWHIKMAYVAIFSLYVYKAYLTVC